MNSRNGSAGYSLFELVMTLTLVALLTLVGLPSFSGLAADKYLVVEVNALFHAVYLARTESIARRRVVSICPSLDGQYCDPSYDWSKGWIVFVNKGMKKPLQRDDDEVVLQHHLVNDASRITANRKGFTLRATQLRATNGTLVFCDRAGRAESRALVISYTGRPRVARKNRAGKPYTCAN